MQRAALFGRSTRKKLKAPRWIWSSLSVVVGFLLFGAVWYLLSHTVAPRVPDPLATLQTFLELIRNPFYDNGPNDKGIAIQLGVSLLRVFAGFLLGVLIALPLGVLVGSSELLRGALNPVIQLLRPVSPLAWFPVGLAAFAASEKAAVFVIAICSLWPTLINTAAGIASVPEDYKNVARVFRFSPWKYLTRVLLPYALVYILTGFRLGLGIAWMVIVAAEMLSGGTGVGFFIWDSYNALDLNRVMAAILLVGLVGWVLDSVLGYALRKVRV
ncbi:Bicarbonate transport system permease protein CmpB [Meiothermus luteus]|uniref:Bicarbonate transport system permease protein CmpB n=1 Tax=Meiothermus luteus TaxID=2026184 RepID=A0A399F1Z8_9DEIN|nr:Bicarbonate transport system permease protein CmpB [Meiothermus luteus]RMH57856.1 MAG: nitrate ABC transporter, permease protein [Deinococcota bacterium]